MPVARPGEVWQTDLGMQAKVRPCLILTHPPNDDELAVTTVVAHTTAVRSNHWEIRIPKPFLEEGAFDVQRVATVATVKLERKLGQLMPQEFESVLHSNWTVLGLIPEIAPGRFQFIDPQRTNYPQRFYRARSL